LLTAALSKLSNAVALLSDAGEEKLAAHLEDIIHQVEALLENSTSPNSQAKTT
jgi:Asp-tRNA(Asn)/Glu-tRNA(Gln) amidotransferase C subunit